MNSVNLIPMGRQLRNARSARLTRWLLVSSCAVCVLVAAGTMLRVSGSRSAGVDAGQSARLENEIAEKMKASNQVRAQIQALERQIQASRQVTEHPDYSVLFALLSRTAGAQITLRQCALDRAQHEGETAKNVLPTLRLSGFGVSQSAVTSFVLRLEQAHVFEQVTLLRSNEQSDAGSVTTAFQLECLFATAGREAP